MKFNKFIQTLLVLFTFTFNICFSLAAEKNSAIPQKQKIFVSKLTLISTLFAQSKNFQDLAIYVPEKYKNEYTTLIKKHKFDSASVPKVKVLQNSVEIDDLSISILSGQKLSYRGKEISFDPNKTFEQNVDHFSKLLSKNQISLFYSILVPTSHAQTLVELPSEMDNAKKIFKALAIAVLGGLILGWNDTYGLSILTGTIAGAFAAFGALVADNLLSKDENGMTDGDRIIKFLAIRCGHAGKLELWTKGDKECVQLQFDEENKLQMPIRAFKGNCKKNEEISIKSEIGEIERVQAEEIYKLKCDLNKDPNSVSVIMNPEIEDAVQIAPKNPSHRFENKLKDKEAQEKPSQQ
jgi:hypothetical protein